MGKKYLSLNLQTTASGPNARDHQLAFRIPVVHPGWLDPNWR